MNREQAMTIVLAEDFSENGLAALADDGGDPGRERINSLIGALAFLHGELADEDYFRGQGFAGLRQSGGTSD